MEIERKLAEMGLAVTEPNPAIGNFVPAVRTGNLVFVSGNLPRLPDGTMPHTGKLGSEVSIEEGAAAARQSAVNCLSAAKSIIGDLDKVQRVVKLLVMVNSDPSFDQQPWWATAHPTCSWNSTANPDATPVPQLVWPPFPGAHPWKWR